MVNVPNMYQVYGVYYDFGAHTEALGWHGGGGFASFCKAHFSLADDVAAERLVEGLRPIGYRGVVDERAGNGDLRLSSIDDKHTRPICFISYNQNGYSTHCRQYHDYQCWVRERNEKRYESNLDKNYDSKNMMHCFRLMHMGEEIAQGKGMALRRTWDHDFLMDIRGHRFEYEELMEMLEAEKERMDRAMAASTIRDSIDLEAVNQMLIDIRKMQLGDFGL